MPGPVSPGDDNPGYRPGGPQRRTTWLWISLAVAVVIIVLLSAVVITQLKNDASDTSTPAAPTQSSAVQSSPPGSTQPQPTGSGSPSMTCEGYTASVDANSQPGWHATIDRRGLAYAVPPDWTVQACGVRMGWVTPCPGGQCVVRELGAVSTVATICTAG